ncbi:DUF3164 family protein [Methylococcus mesophilus]|uniref:DUF3164 family protein n=1 Tax=Methylococcus mesophilus TaxID=2993564 RepID=UPI00224B9972|nr:DUF3164 family protein [Methylococcus mesophilus]UZR27450.1 DUF3164 family protein [Methylococcus mesophilus]
MATAEQIHGGFWRDAEGRLIPENLIKPIDKEREALVTALTAAAKEMSEALARFKSKAFADIGAFVELSAEQYGVKLGGKKGNVTLMSFDGRYKVIRQIQEHLVFDERLQAAKALIDECIQAWTEGSRDEIKALINDAFQVNKEGKINTGRVLGLKRLDIRDERWQRAMQAIADSVQVAGSKPYFRVYERVGDTDQYQAISLDIAGA